MSEALSMPSAPAARHTEGRDRLDRYYTPDDLAETLVELLVQWRGWNFEGASTIEPSIGGGAFARALRARGAHVRGVDIDPGASFQDCDSPIHGDFLDVDLRLADYVIGNPPYARPTGRKNRKGRDIMRPCAELHVRRALGLGRKGVAMLLRLAILESSVRVPFWRSHPPAKVYVLAQRPTFTGTGTDYAAYGWFIWEPRCSETRFEVLSWR